MTSPQEILKSVQLLTPWSNLITVKVSGVVRGRTLILEWNDKVDLQDFLIETVEVHGYIPLHALKKSYSPKVISHETGQRGVSFIFPNLSFALSISDLKQMFQAVSKVYADFPSTFDNVLNYIPLFRFPNLLGEDLESSVLLYGSESSNSFPDIDVDFNDVTCIKDLQDISEELQQLLVIANLASLKFTVILPNSNDTYEMSLQEVSDLYHYLTTSESYLE